MIKTFLAKIVAKLVYNKTQKWAKDPINTQKKVFLDLIENSKNTLFGREHHFDKISSHADFVKYVPIRDYEQFKSYIDKIIEGQSDVLWKGKPLYFAKTSGTTSGTKYIPLTRESIPYHIQATRNAILHYIYETGNVEFVNGKMIFLQGSPILQEKNGIFFGRLSGIAAHFVPQYLQKNRMPSMKTNCIEDWDTKIEAIVDETLQENMTVISGIPSWVQMYFERLEQRTHKKIGTIFKNFSLFIYGGVNYEPYRTRFENLIGRKVDSIELFPASEGFFAYQNTQKDTDMLLLLKTGIFYEFIKSDEFYMDNPRRYTIGEVTLGVHYVLIISTNAGLWGYNLGDVIQFTSTNPYKIIVVGRIKHFISAFGEHVIAKEVEQALKEAMKETTIQINEFTVAPQVTPKKGLPYHEWFIEFEEKPQNLDAFAKGIDDALCKQNSYYKDLIVGKVLRTLVITPVAKNGFQQYMKSIGKLGGQNKLPRLSNDRFIAESVSKELKDLTV